MPAKKNAVTTPLHLLQQLSQSLVSHLEKACNEALKDAEMTLAKLEKQRGRTQEKIIKARAKLDDAGSAGKSKVQTKARAKLAELDDMLAVLQARQSDTLSYLAELKRDAEQSLKLAQGITQVENAAAQALAARGKPAAGAANRRKPASSTASASASKPAVSKAASGSRPAASRAKPAASVTQDKAGEAKAPVGKAPSTARRRPARTTAKAAATAAPAPAAKPAVAKKPAASKGKTADQASPVAG
ncbi:AlgP family protein [Pseudomonas stutzeri]|uniref:AlgP family protein n=1 Tax=Stutzerimonas stutzeri TaxID=316 RepID=UPI001F525551|nr:AlgP family protein [Stutzerimonas stutzeri]MCI0917100.1 AlgP family protein [Stutzerimonas stutzeri]